MTDRSLSEQVRGWFTKTGLPLELETASAFKRAGFGVEHSSIYADPEMDKGREIDVIAHTRDPSGIIQTFVTVECKSSPNPWVVLTNKEDYWNLTYFSLGVTSPATRSSLNPELLNHSGITDLLKDIHTGGYAVRQAFCKDNDPAYAAAMSALKASAALVSSQDLAPPRLVFALPAIIVDSPIFECHMDKRGELQFWPVEMSQFLFTAHVPERTRAIIRIVSKGALPYFTTHCFKLAQGLQAELKYKVDEWMESVRKRT